MSNSSHSMNTSPEAAFNTQSQRLAAWAMRASYDDLSDDARQSFKNHILDTLGCALGALGEGPILACRAQVEEFGGTGPCTLIGGGTTAPPQAAFYNTCLTRYLDFMDNFLGESETCHPCDNFASVLAAAEYAGASGRDFLAALAVAYQVQCRMTQAAPIMQRGFDHTAQLAFSVPAGVARALGMNAEQAANAIGICGAGQQAFAVIRAVPISQWKGLASSQTALGCTHAAFLARRGVTGPLFVFEGPKGFVNAISEPIEVDWDSEKLDVIIQTLLKSYNSEVHTQTAVQCTLELHQANPFDPADVAAIDVEDFQVAYDITGGGAYGEKHTVRTKEHADHSIPYVVAAALLDGEVWPAQYAPERIARDDIQRLLHKVTVRPNDNFTQRYPKQMPCRVTVRLRNGEILAHDVVDYPGFPTRAFTWEQTCAKFERLAAKSADASLQAQIEDAVSSLDTRPVADLTRLLAQAGPK